MITPLEKMPVGFEEDIAFIRTESLFKCYFGIIPSVRFFCQKNGERITAVISKSDGVINLSADECADFEELLAFVYSLSGRLFCSYRTLLRLETGLPYVCGDIMRYVKEGKEKASDGTSPDIKSLYSGMKQEFELPSFEDFYTDIFYRRRQNGVHFCFTDEEGFVISSAMTVAESENSAIIGGVFTRDEHRKKGLGLKNVKGLCEILDKENIYVMIRDPHLCEFYARAGFERSGIWTETEI